VNVLLSSTDNKFIGNARTMWLKSVEGALRKINNSNNYNKELLIEMISRIPYYTRNETNGLLTVIRALFKVGVTVIYQPYPHNTQIRGASFVLGGKPCIVLTDYNKRYDTIWWTLMHELYHVLYDYDRLKKTVFHLSGEEDIFLSEEKANKFATDCFLSDDKFKFIAPLINSEIMVENQAKVWNIHPSLIYGFYMFKNKGSISKYRWRIPKSMVATKDINVNLMESDTLVQAVEKLVSKVFNL
jgi:Zn-dependent peptidase ImmA (M78 family)